MKNEKDSFDVLNSIANEFIQKKLNLANSYETKIKETILSILKNFEMGDGPVELIDAWIDDSSIWFIVEFLENGEARRLCCNNDELEKMIQNFNKEEF